MTKDEIAAKLRKAYEADEFFPGALGNPVAVASRWRLPLSTRYVSRPATKAPQQKRPRHTFPDIHVSVGSTILIGEAKAHALGLENQPVVYARVRDAVVRGTREELETRPTPQKIVDAAVVRLSKTSHISRSRTKVCNHIRDAFTANRKATKVRPGALAQRIFDAVQTDPKVVKYKYFSIHRARNAVVVIDLGKTDAPVTAYSVKFHYKPSGKKLVAHDSKKA